jgi:hypothetical protein
MIKFNTLGESVKNSEGQTSSKRLVTLLSFCMICIISLFDMFTSFKVSSHIFDGLMWIVLAGLGFISSERFSNIKNTSK